MGFGDYHDYHKQGLQVPQTSCVAAVGRLGAGAGGGAAAGAAGAAAGAARAATATIALVAFCALVSGVPRLVVPVQSNSLSRVCALTTTQERWRGDSRWPPLDTRRDRWPETAPRKGQRSCHQRPLSVSATNDMAAFSLPLATLFPCIGKG